MILVYEKEPAAAAEITRALAHLGREARVLDSFMGITVLARTLRPDAVVFSFDRNSEVTGRELGTALAQDGIPLVQIASRSRNYWSFVGMLGLGRPDRFWSLERPFSAEEVRDVVQRALAAGKAAPLVASGRRRAGSWALLVLVLALHVALVLEWARDVLRVARGGSSTGASLLWLLLLCMLLWLAYRAVPAALAVRHRVPVPWTAWVWIALQALFTAGLASAVLA